MTWLNDPWKKGTKIIMRNQISKVNNLQRSALLNNVKSVRKNSNI